MCCFYVILSLTRQRSCSRQPILIIETTCHVENNTNDNSNSNDYNSNCLLFVLITN